MNDAQWRVAESIYVLESPYLRLRKDTIDLPDGTRVEDYYVRESRGYAIIFALTADDRVTLVQQYKHGVARTLLELPAGAIDPDEAPEKTARRELAEETGYAAQSFQLLRAFVTDPTNADTVAHLFLARNAKRVAPQRLDATEDITVRLATLDELLALVRDGTIDSMPHVAAIYYVLDLFRMLSSRA